MPLSFGDPYVDYIFKHYISEYYCLIKGNLCDLFLRDSLSHFVPFRTVFVMSAGSFLLWNVFVKVFHKLDFMEV